MGWCNDDGQHEGFLVGLVRQDWRWRELGHEDRDVDRVRCVQVACDCGWRSSRIVAPFGTTFMPCIVLASELFEELCHQLWREHVADEARHPKMRRTSQSDALMPFDELSEMRERRDRGPCT